MTPLKHIGRLKNTNTKVLVVFRTLPGESNHALVLPVAALSDSYHDSIMKLVESDPAQETFEFGEIMFTRTFPDGRPMLQALKADNILKKLPTDTIEMTPTTSDVVDLHQLNVLIAEQRNCAVDDLHTFVSGAPKKTDATVEEIVKVKDLGRDVGEPAFTEKVPPLKANLNEVLTDTDIAKNYRSQADAMYKEAARLRKQADELDPPKKKATKVSEEASA
jgi:hypothetical protein